MSTTEILINIGFVAIVLRQMRERHLAPRDLVRPLALLALVASTYLHGIPTGGNDLVLIGLCMTLGLTLGGLSAAATTVRPDGEGGALVRARGIAAVLLAAGIGARMAFAYAAAHGAGPAIAGFSIAHHITGSQAWTAALVLMAICEVTTRLAVVHLRAMRVSTGTARTAPVHA